MPYCSSCGSEVRENTAYCSSCGNKLVPISPPPYIPPGRFKPSFGDEDRFALRKLRRYAIILLITSIFETGWFVIIELDHDFMFSGQRVVFELNYFLLFTSAFIVSGIVGIYLAILLRSIFKRLAGADLSFKSPATFQLVYIISLPFFLAGLIIFFYWLFSLVAQLPVSNPPPPTLFLNLGYLVAGSILVSIVGIAELVGEIGGQILGMWRIGTRYDDSAIKIAAILFVVPFASVASPILILLSVNSLKKRLFFNQTSGSQLG
ncbi:MAG: zinc ribbon domain-containing protein [Nitrososphaerales archaeon]